MKSVKPYFEEELKNTIQSIRTKKQDSDLIFSIVTDSHLSDNGENTMENIAAIDEQIGFECVVHMGDFVNGNNPEKVTRKNLREELEGYKNAVKTGKLYVAQGNHDGYRDETFKRQLVCDMALDENWYEDTKFIDNYDNVKRVGNKPYFYVDYPEKQLRMIFLCTTAYKIDKAEKKFSKIYGMYDEQIEWLGDALNTPSEYDIMVFSHIPPFKRNNKNPNTALDMMEFIPDEGPNYQNAVALINAYNTSKSVEVNGKKYDYSDKKGSVIAWFFGHDHSDFTGERDGINYIGVTSETAYIPQLWEAMGEYPSPRDLGTVSEDAWDTVLWSKNERKVYMYRFGAGKDRVISY